MMHKLLISLTFIFLFAGGASADFIISPISVMQNTAGEPYPEAPIEDTINQSGLSLTFISGVTDFDTYFAGNPLHEMDWTIGEWWGTEGIGRGTIDYDLGQAYLLNRVALWNEDSEGGFLSFQLYTDVNSDFSTATSHGTFYPTDNAYAVDYPADIFSFAETLGRYVRLEVVSARGDWLAMGEIAFAAVPVPGAVLLGILGLSAVGIRLRKYA